MHRIDQDKRAYVAGFAYYDDNLQLLRAQLEQIVRRVAHLERLSILSLGVGHRVTMAGLLERLGPRLRRLVIVEGSREIIELARAELGFPATVELVESYFEAFETEERFDVVELGFVLEHVEDPEAILRRFRRFLAPDGRMMIAVPNAHSIHRLIGFRAGLMRDVHQLGEADLALGHRRYFDPGQLADLVSRCGLEITGRAGLMLKPLTTAQLASLGLDERVLAAMNEVAFDLPDVANGIFLEVRPCR